MNYASLAKIYPTEKLEGKNNERDSKNLLLFSVP
jgi:hypothetical protein